MISDWRKVTQSVKMEPLVKKKIRLDDQNVVLANEIKFLDMNDDCISAILEFLPLRDLNMMSLACKRIYQISDSVYRRQHMMNEWTTVKEHFPSKEVRMFEFECNSGLVPKRFMSEFPNIYVDCWPSIELFDFIKAKCCGNFFIVLPTLDTHTVR